MGKKSKNSPTAIFDLVFDDDFKERCRRGDVQEAIKRLINSVINEKKMPEFETLELIAKTFCEIEQELEDLEEDESVISKPENMQADYNNHRKKIVASKLGYTMQVGQKKDNSEHKIEIAMEFHRLKKEMQSSGEAKKFIKNNLGVSPRTVDNYYSEFGWYVEQWEELEQLRAKILTEKKYLVWVFEHLLEGNPPKDGERVVVDIKDRRITFAPIQSIKNSELHRRSINDCKNSESIEKVIDILILILRCSLENPKNIDTRNLSTERNWDDAISWVRKLYPARFTDENEFAQE